MTTAGPAVERRIIIAAEAGIAVRSAADVGDAIGACLGADGLLLTEDDLSPLFFDLRTGFAGELLQKFVNYRVRVALVVPRPEDYGERFTELAREHASHHAVRFVRTRAEAESWLCS